MTGKLSPWLMMIEEGGSSHPMANEFVYKSGDALEAKGRLIQQCDVKK